MLYYSHFTGKETKAQGDEFPDTVYLVWPDVEKHGWGILRVRGRSLLWICSSQEVEVEAEIQRVLLSPRSFSYSKG